MKKPNNVDDVHGPWWSVFEEMLTPEQREELGVSEDRGAVICIMRTLTELREVKGWKDGESNEVKETKRKGPHCHHCGSTNTDRSADPRWWICHSCGNHF